MLDEGECWAAVTGRDAASDGLFVYAATSTGIYCRPSCSTPIPLRRNARFFSSAVAAEAAGFCACKRCRPSVDSPSASHVVAVSKACEMLRARERIPSLATIAAAVGISPFHLHRILKEALGVTPGEYAQAVRWQRLADSLEAGGPVAEAIYGAGYGSMSRVYEKARQMLGMTPAERRAGGAGCSVRFAVAPSNMGPALVAATVDGVCAIEFGDDRVRLEARLRRRLPAAVVVERRDVEVADRLNVAIRRAALPLRARELPSEVRNVAFRIRLRKAIKPGLIAELPHAGAGHCPAAQAVTLPLVSGRVGSGRRVPPWRADGPTPLPSHRSGSQGTGSC